MGEKRNRSITRYKINKGGKLTASKRHGFLALAKDVDRLDGLLRHKDKQIKLLNKAIHEADCDLAKLKKNHDEVVLLCRNTVAVLNDAQKILTALSKEDADLLAKARQSLTKRLPWWRRIFK